MSQKLNLGYLGLNNTGKIRQNLPLNQLVAMALKNEEGVLASNGALNVTKTGERTGRSPKDRFIVKGPGADGVQWGKVNRPISQESFDTLLNFARSYLQNREVYTFDGFAGADPDYRIQVRIVTEKAWHSLFARTLFIEPKPGEQLKEVPDFTVLNVCGLQSPAIEELGLNSGVFVTVDFGRKIVLIGGTHYAGEIKKSIFSVMNHILPPQNVFPMHCSANIGREGDTALFFGLSGTGKTTLSADPTRRLIGDDEHGWTDKGVFNFEGGCYAKCIKLSKEAEPQIFNAIRFGSVLENVVLDENGVPDYDDGSITENTRGTYPTEYIDNCVQEGVGTHPRNVFFLAADAFGVLPPISKLTPEQAMYHFLSGYTAKLAGTESGINEPITTFSACFGAPFMTRNPSVYAKMLGEKMNRHNTSLWLVNTGWSGGGYSVGSRMKIGHTRTLLTAALEGKLNKASFTPHPIFKVLMPDHCPGVPDEILNPRNTWKNPADYDRAARSLATEFISNFKSFQDAVTPDILSAAPTP